MFSDLVLVNGNVITVGDYESIVEAVAVKFGKFILVGSNEDVKRSIGDDTNVIDLEGKTVIPGLIDSHSHMISTGLRTIRDIDLSEEMGIKSIIDIKKKIAEKAKTTAMDEWIIGVKEDDSKLKEKRHPNKWELDQAAPFHPVIVHTVGGHFCVVNSRAFEKAGITKETENPVGGVFERDSVTGELTGGVHEKAINLITSINNYGQKITTDEAINGVKKMLLMNAAAGLTCIYDSVGRSHIRAILELKNRQELPIRIRMDIGIELFPEMEKLGIYRGLGDEWVRICGLKFFFDGAISARTAAVSEPYLHKSNYYGIMSTTENIARKKILEALDAGYRLSAHANGERAINMYLDIMAEAQVHKKPTLRNRIIHCSVVTPDIVSRIKNLKMLPTIFGSYPYYHGDKLIPAFGKKRLERMFAARWFLDSGIKVAAHSDYSASPFPPLMGIHSLVNRKSKSGESIGKSQSISVMEALRLYTINAAYHSFDEDTLGSIEVGKYADMVVLGRDILSVPKEEIITIPIVMTIIGGETVYRRV